MKKLVSLLFVVLISSCNTSNDEPTKMLNMDLLKNSFKEMTIESLNFAATLDFVDVEKISNDDYRLILNVSSVSLLTESRLLQHQFNGSNLSDMHILPVSPGILYKTEENARVNESVENLLDTVSIFGENQKIIMKELTDKIFKLEFLDEGYAILDSFEQEFIDSNDLTEAEMVQLIEFTSSTRALLDFMSGDGVQSMFDQMAPEFNDSSSNQNGRVMGCEVGWRSVWAGAVVGFTVGAVRGGIVGAAGGTAVFPGLGTATGVVGGAVFGGALGFIGGASASVAANLLTSCFRPSFKGELEASCRKTYELYLKGLVKSVPSSCYSVILGI